MKTICLNMIVKNENSVIQRCLESVKNIIDFWIIVDTGSTDGTQQIIKNFMKDVPGELYERPWVNFEHNRNEALELAKGIGDYLLFLDADDKLVFPDSFIMPELKADFYFSIYRQDNSSFQGEKDSLRVLLVNNLLQWQWKGILHETIHCFKENNIGYILEDVITLALTGGNRYQDPNTIYQDIKTLEKALEEDPENGRYIFHLAMSYAATNQYSLALDLFQKRADLGDNKMVVFFSLYQIGEMQRQLEMDPDILMNSYFKAYIFRSSRAEPLYRIVEQLITTHQFFLGYLISKHALLIPCPKDYYFTENWIYEWGLLYQFYRCSYEIGKYAESTDAMNKLLLIKDFPSIFK